MKRAPHRVDAFGDLPINYTLDRPFNDWGEIDLQDCFESALSLPQINLELCTLIFLEIQEQGGDTHEIRRKLKLAGGSTIPWLKGARHRIKHHISSFKKSGKSPKNCKVYLVLLTEDRETPIPWGVYIGQTSKTIERRLEVHFEVGNKHGSRHVRKRGWQLLHSLTNLIPAMTKQDTEKFEGLLLDSFCGDLRFKPLRRLPANRVKGAGPKEYRIKNRVGDITIKDLNKEVRKGNN